MVLNAKMAGDGGGWASAVQELNATMGKPFSPESKVSQTHAVIVVSHTYLP